MIRKRVKKLLSSLTALSMMLSLAHVTEYRVRAAGLSTMVEKYYENAYEVTDNWTIAYGSITTKGSTDPVIDGNDAGLPGNGPVYYKTVTSMNNPVSGWGMVRRKPDWSRILTDISDYVETGVLSFKFKINNASYIPYLYGYLADAATSTVNFVGVNFSDQYTAADVNTWKVINIPLKEFVNGSNVYKYTTDINLTKINGAGVMFPNAYDVQEEVSFWFDDLYVRNVIAPTGISVTESTESSATISWEASASDIVRYEILRDGVVVGQTNAQTLEYTDDTLEESTTYEFAVRAIDSYEAPSNCTDTVSVYTASIGNPNNLVGESGFANELKTELSWESPDFGTVAGYKIYRNDTLIGEVDASTLTYTDKIGLINNMSYNYYVISVAENGAESMPSNIVDVTVNTPSAIDVKLSANSGAVTVGSKTVTTISADQPDLILKSAEITINYASDILSVENNNDIILSNDWKNAGAVVTLNTGEIKVTLPENAESVTIGDTPININFTALNAGTSSVTMIGAGIEKDTNINVGFTQDGSAELTVTEVSVTGIGTTVETYYENGYETVGDSTIAYGSISSKGSTDPVIDGNNAGLPGNGPVYYKTVTEMSNPVSGWGMVKRNTGTWARILTDISDYVDTGVLSFKFKINNASYIPYLYGYLADAATSTVNFVGVNFSDQYTAADVNTWKVINIPLKEFVNGSNVYKYTTDINLTKINGAGVMFPNAYDVQEEVSFWFDDLYVRNVIAPTGIKVTNSTESSATISWDASISAVMGYEILRDGVVVGQTNAQTLEYTDNTLEESTTYEFAVRAIDSYEAPSNCTDTVSVYTALTGKPNNLIGKSGFANELKTELSWEAPDYGAVSGYKIYRNDILIGEVDASTYAYTDREALANNTSYNYYIVSFAENGTESMPSNKVEVHVANIAFPTNLSAIVSGNSITLQWDAVAEATKYKIYCNGNVVDEVQSCHFVHQDRDYSKSYTYTVTAVNATGAESLHTKEVLATTMDTNTTVGETVFSDMTSEGYITEKLGSTKFNIDRDNFATGASSLKIMFETGSNVPEGITLAKSLDLLSARTNGGAIALYIFAENQGQLKDVKLGLECQSDKLGDDTYVARTSIELSNYIDSYGYWNYVEIPLKDFSEIGKYTAGIAEATQKFKFDKVTGLSIYTDKTQYMEEKSILCDDIRFISNPNYVVTAPNVNEVKLSANATSVTVGSGVATSISSEKPNTVLKSAEITINYASDILTVSNNNDIIISNDWKNAGAVVTLNAGEVKVTLPETLAGVKLSSTPIMIKFNTIKVGSSSLSFTGSAVEKDTDANLSFVQSGPVEIKVINVSTGGGSSSGGGGGSTGGGRDSATVYPTVNIPVSGSDGNTSQATSTFKDVDVVSWAKDAINGLAEKGIVSGYSDGEFKPNNNVTREEFIKMLLSALSSQIDESAECTFDDAAQGTWYYTYLANAQKDGISVGYDNKFGVGDFITREDMCTMALRAVEIYNISLNKSRDAITFADNDEISDYAKDAVASLYEVGVINGVGDSRFEPNTNVTRAMAAKVIYELLNFKN